MAVPMRITKIFTITKAMVSNRASYERSHHVNNSKINKVMNVSSKSDNSRGGFRTQSM